jgi:hypothetical protein
VLFCLFIGGYVGGARLLDCFWDFDFVRELAYVLEQN